MVFFIYKNMKWIKKFESFNIPYYNSEWEKFLPNEITIIKGQENFIQRKVYKKGNIMLHSDMVQITYTHEEYQMDSKDVVPEIVEFDIYFVKNGNISLDVDITYGDTIASEFKIDGDKVHVIQYTSYGSKFDPSNTVFALDEKSLINFINFFNMFEGVNVDREQFNFLDENPNNYKPD